MIKPVLFLIVGNIISPSFSLGINPYMYVYFLVQFSNGLLFFSFIFLHFYKTRPLCRQRLFCFFLASIFILDFILSNSH